jgi:hypothetical protein
LEDLCEDNFKRMGGVDKVVCPAAPCTQSCADQ